MATCKSCGTTVKWYRRDLLFGTCWRCTARTRKRWYTAAIWLFLLALWVRSWMSSTTDTIERLDQRTGRSLETLKEEQRYNLKRIGDLDDQIKGLRADLKKSSPKTPAAADSKSEK
mgnify:FL=1